VISFPQHERIPSTNSFIPLICIYSFCHSLSALAVVSIFKEDMAEGKLEDTIGSCTMMAGMIGDVSLSNEIPMKGSFLLPVKLLFSPEYGNEGALKPIYTASRTTARPHPACAAVTSSIPASNTYTTYSLHSINSNDFFRFGASIALALKRGRVKPGTRWNREGKGQRRCHLQRGRFALCIFER